MHGAMRAGRCAFNSDSRICLRLVHDIEHRVQDQSETFLPTDEEANGEAQVDEYWEGFDEDALDAVDPPSPVKRGKEPTGEGEGDSDDAFFASLTEEQLVTLERNA